MSTRSSFPKYNPRVLPVKKPELPSRARRYSPSERDTILSAAQQTNMEELKRQFGVCRETVSRWKRRDLQASENSSDEAIPDIMNHSGPYRIAAAVRDRHLGYHRNWKEVLHLWRSRPGLGPAQIRNQLFRQGIRITVPTVRKILEENGYTPPKATVKEVHIQRYEAARPLELVHLDFKHFYIHKHKAFLLLAQDDFSRFILGHRMSESENMKVVIELFEECVNRYGKMQTLMTDAGSAFYSWNGINRFQKLVAHEYGIDQIKAGSPRSNGKIENVNKQIEKEVLNIQEYSSLEDADQAIAEWIQFYNFERTHLGLPAGTVPADRFMPGWNSGPDQLSLTVKDPLSVPRPARDLNSSTSAWEEILKLALEHIKKAA